MVTSSHSKGLVSPSCTSLVPACWKRTLKCWHLLSNSQSSVAMSHTVVCILHCKGRPKHLWHLSVALQWSRLSASVSGEVNHCRRGVRHFLVKVIVNKRVHIAGGETAGTGGSDGSKPSPVVDTVRWGPVGGAHDHQAGGAGQRDVDRHDGVGPIGTRHAEPKVAHLPLAHAQSALS